MRILLDTNVFIPLEDSSIDIDTALAELNRIVSAKHQLLVHPATADDIARDKNEERRRKILARLDKYPSLESPPIFSNGEEEELIGIPSKDNDRVDNLILLAVPKPDGACCPVRKVQLHSKNNGDIETLGTELQTPSRSGYPTCGAMPVGYCALRGLTPKFGFIATHKESCGGLWEPFPHQGIDPNGIMAKVKAMLG